MSPFTVGTEVIARRICHIDSTRQWIRGVVSNENYEVGKQELSDNPEMASDIKTYIPNTTTVSYRVHLPLLDTPKHVLIFDAERQLLPISGENLVRCGILPISENELEDQDVIGLFLLALKLRRPQTASHLWEAIVKMKHTVIPTHPEMLTAILHSEQKSFPTTQEEEDFMLTGLKETLDWCNVTFRFVYRNYRDRLRRQPEHLAALRGDKVLTRFLLQHAPKGKKAKRTLRKGDTFFPSMLWKTWEERERFVVDDFGDTPLHCMLQKRRIDHLEMYTRGVLEMDNCPEWCVRDCIGMANKEGVTAYEAARHDSRLKETMDAFVEALCERQRVDLRQAILCLENEMVKQMVREVVSTKQIQSTMDAETRVFTDSLKEKLAMASPLSHLQEKWDNEQQCVYALNSKTLWQDQKTLVGELPIYKEYPGLVHAPSLLSVAVATRKMDRLLWVLSKGAKTNFGTLHAGMMTASYCNNVDAIKIMLGYYKSVIRANDMETNLLILLQCATKAMSDGVVSFLVSMVKPTNVKDHSSAVLACVTNCFEPWTEDKALRTELLPRARKASARLEAIVSIRKHLLGDQAVPMSKMDWSARLKSAVHTATDKDNTVPITKELIDWLVRETNAKVEPLERVTPSTPQWLVEICGGGLARRVQPWYRGYQVRQRLARQYPGFGMWSSVLLHVTQLTKSPPMHPSFGKSWVQIKLDCNYVGQLEESALGDSLVDGEEFDEDLEEAPIMSKSPSRKTNKEPEKVYDILLTGAALRWIRKQKDERYKELLMKRLNQLASGEMSLALAKRLQGSAREVFETKLDKGQRIIWTRRGETKLIWFVCKHDKISRCCELVDLSYSRVVAKRQTQMEELVSAAEGEGGVAQATEEEPEMLADPIANVPLKIHSVDVGSFNRLVHDSSWTPPLRLTELEREIVERPGAVLLLGRSGTGKTLCVCSRMAYDRQAHSVSAKSRIEPLRQLFVARTQRLCDYVSALQSRMGMDVAGATFERIDDLVEELAPAPHDAQQRVETGWKKPHKVTFRRYSGQIWDVIKGREEDMNALLVWTQIRSFIKGSLEAALAGRPLSLTEYRGLSRNRCRLTDEQRCRAYALFELYQGTLDRNGWWDQEDRVGAAILRLKDNGDGAGGMAQVLYHRIYVDEVQDMTQAEIYLLLLTAGNNHDALFFAGDTAQSVSYGVDFRFEEVRAVVDEANRRIDKPIKLSCNFRSHEGILLVSNVVLDRLHKAFPKATTKLPSDTGLVQGPRPGLLRAGLGEIKDLLARNNRIRVLVRDESKPRVQEELGSARHMCLGIREAKGLEFRDVILLDFFNDNQDRHHKEWKKLWLDEGSKAINLPVTLEVELKLLYTAITRSCDRLFFVETKDSKCFDFWCRCLEGGQLANTMKPEALDANAMMTNDDWLIEGVEMASLAADCEDTVVALNHLKRAVACFEKANDKHLASKCAKHLEAVKLTIQASEPAKDVHRIPQLSVEAVLAYLNAGLLPDAVRACRDMCNVPGFARVLERHIKEIPLKESVE